MAATDNFSSYANELNTPATNAVAVTPSDTTDLTNVTRGVYVGGAGDIVVDMLGSGSTIKFAAAQAGVVYPLRVKRIHSTNTTATNIVALW